MRENVLVYSSLNIICSSKSTVLLELRSRKIVHVLEQIMSADISQCIFPRQILLIYQSQTPLQTSRRASSHCRRLYIIGRRGNAPGDSGGLRKYNKANLTKNRWLLAVLQSSVQSEPSTFGTFDPKKSLSTRKINETFLSVSHKKKF